MNTNFYNTFLSFFSEEGIGGFRGLFSIHHLIFSLVGVILVTLFLYLSRNLTFDKINKIMKIMFFVLVVLEILKIVWNLTIRTDKSMDNWVPLYFCSLFIYALGMVSFGKGKIKEIGIILIIYGQIVGAIAFILYPSSSIGIHPLIHILSIHSLIYHASALYIGLLLLISGYYKEYAQTSIKHNFHIYFLTVFIIEVFVYVFNLIFKTNLMFINEPGVVPILQKVQDIFGDSYPLVISITQALGTFIIGLSIVKIVELTNNKKAW